MNFTEGSTWRGLVRLGSVIVALVVGFNTGSAEEAQAAAAHAADTFNELGAIITMLIGEGVKGLIGVFKADSA